MPPRPTIAAAMTRLRRANLAEQLGVPVNETPQFYAKVQGALKMYRDVSTPKGHPDSPAQAGHRFRAVGQAAVSGSPKRVQRAMAGLTAEQHARLRDLAGAQSAWSRRPKLKEVAAAAVMGSGSSRQWSAGRRAKQGKPPPRTLGQVVKGRPEREDIEALVSFLAAALAGSTGQAATRGSKNATKVGALIPSPLERLVTAAQAALGEVGEWNVVDRVRGHIASRDNKPRRRK